MSKRNSPLNSKLHLKPIGIDTVISEVARVTVSLWVDPVTPPPTLIPHPYPPPPSPLIDDKKKYVHNVML